jgi:Zn-dependent peptidase ImmA (M78 family)
MNIGARICQVREFRGLSQYELANKIGVNQSVIAHLELGKYLPSDAGLKAIAFQAGFPARFFRQPNPVPEFSLGSLQYRARTGIPAREKARAYRYGQLAYELAERLGQRTTRYPLRLPHIDAPPGDAANMMRAALGFGPDQPVKSVLRTLEKVGIIVLGMPVKFVGQDAYSLWTGNGDPQAAVIVLSSGNPGDRIRFSALHELRHLTSVPRGTAAEIERDADRFSAEFLLPVDAMRRELVPPITLTLLAQLKAKWGVAIQTLVRRAADIEVITQRQYKYLMQQISARGWRLREPVDIPAERPRSLRKMAEVLYGNPIDYRRLAAEMDFPLSFVRELMEAHQPAPNKPENTGKVVTFRGLNPS